MIIYASSVAEWMYRGSDYQLAVDLLDENGDLTTLAIDDTVYLTLFKDINDATPVLQIEADIYYRDIGLAIFTFVPDDTVDLIARSYDIAITIKDGDGKLRPILTQRFAIVPFNPPVFDEEEA